MLISLIIIASLALYVGLQNLVLAVRRPDQPVYRTFSILALTLAFHDFCQLNQLMSTTVEERMPWNWVQWVTEFACLWLLVAFVANLAEKRARRLLAVLGGVLLVFLGFHLFMEDGFAFRNVRGVVLEHYPWGEARYRLVRDVTTGYYLFLTVLILCLVWCVQTAVQMVVAGARRRGWSLLVTLGVVIVAIALSVIRDIWRINLPPVIDHSFVAMTVLMSLVLSDEVVSSARLQRSLAQSEQNLRTMLDAIHDGVIATDSSGSILRLNPAASRLTGWASPDAVGCHLMDVFQVVDVETRQNATSEIWRSVLAGQTFQTESRMALIGGELERLIAVSAAPIFGDLSGESVVGSVLVFRDVTEHERLEDQLRQSQKLEAIGQLAGGVAHDFNNMLGGIMGAAEVLRPSIPVEDDEARSFLDLIIQATERAADLTSKLLAFSRKGKQISTPIDLHDIIRNTMVMFERSVDRRIEIGMSLTSTNAQVVGDPSQLQSALLNLALNARDAMPDGGKLLVETRTDHLASVDCESSPFELEPGPYLRIMVRDDGSGISMEDREHIFEPFFTTKAVGQGTGLGLSAVYGTVKDHQGAIEVYSELGKGTVFHILLPLADSASVLPTPVPETRLQGEGTVLVVDDEDLIRHIATRLLEDLGYRVIAVPDGEAALEAFEHHRSEIDLVLLDAVMPKLSGREVFEDLRKRAPNLRIILCSGFALDASISDLRAKGLAGFLKKPYRRNELADMLFRVRNGTNS